MTAPIATESRAPAGRRRPVVWPLYAATLCLSLTWLAASPALDGPDERDHAIRAVATAHGEVAGTFEPSALGELMAVQVPRALCPLLVAVRDCQPGATADQARVTTDEYRHPPLYYALVGVPSLFGTGRWVGYAMRGIGAIVCSALFACALHSAINTRRRLAVLAVFATMTPTAWFLTGQVNPNGLEVAAMVALWSTSLTLATQRAARWIEGAWGCALVAAVASRGISPGFAAIAVVAALALTTTRRRRALTKARRLRAGSAAAAAALAVSAAWVVAIGLRHNEPRVGHGVVARIGHSMTFLRQAVGDTIDLHVSVPVVVDLYAVVAAAVVVAALRHGAGRHRWILLAVLGIALVLPVTSDGSNLPPAGVGWQGRYGLALLVGPVIVAGYVAGRDLTQRVWWLGIGAIAGAELSAFVVFAREWVADPDVVWLLAGLHLCAVGALVGVLAAAPSGVRAQGAPAPRT